MARYKDASCRLCRREGEKLFLKGDRCFKAKCSVSKRGYAPGQHGQQRKKLSEYGIQLREKQKARRFYGVLESQFEKYFDMAANQKGVTGENLLAILESRLDNVVYRMGLASSRPESRQLVTHGQFIVNGKRVNIPSYLVKPGDIITVCDRFKATDKIKAIIESVGARVVPKWLDFDPETLTCKVVERPTREDVDIPIKEYLIVELYSK